MASEEVSVQEIQIGKKKRLAVTVRWCKPCGICMALCPRQVLGAEEVTGKVTLVAPTRCTGCGLCELYCPDYVFAIEEVVEDSARGNDDKEVATGQRSLR